MTSRTPASRNGHSKSADSVGQITMTGRYTSSEVSVSGDWAVDRYTATLTATPKAGGSATEEKIKGVHIMKRQPDGTWKVVT